MITKLKKAWQTFKDEQEKKELIRVLTEKTNKAFHSAKLFLVQKNKITDLDMYIYPKIQSVRLLDFAEIVFTIPKGMNPKDVKIKEYVFKQYLSEYAELEGELLRFVIRIVPNEIKTIKYNYNAFKIQKEKIPIVCGVNKYGKYMIYDMVTHAHLLIAGETGSGKSSQIRSVLTTLIQNKTTDNLHLYLCDLKQSEFHLFQKVKHVQSVTYTPEELYPVLFKLKKEIQRRGKLLNQHGINHIDKLPEKIPYIVMCIDEYPMLAGERESIKIIKEISAIGRTNGVFLILSMQRPDAEVLDGKIKNNLTVSMGFRCKNATNSKIMDCAGAENIPKSAKGRMILNFDTLETIQAPYLTEEKAKEILKPYCRLESEKTIDNGSIETSKRDSIFGQMED
ncbi:chromosome partitioning protein ParA [[Bacillus thuringiensis] serovar konkukian]|nr:FtsK/SpoIIIE domain-containing protein [Bacillus thuringiensis]MED1305188.1 FtsK/SpoIIIE domain-containing protein [Bacillus pacificus]OUB09023.1 chromosome partitioning protein ParA [[Bacillus thuringiensis] serovar konkukian]